MVERGVLEPINISDIDSLEDWFERFDLYIITNDEIDNDDKKRAHLLTLMGKHAYRLLKELCHPNLPSKLTPDEIKTCLTDYLKPKNYEVHERAIFNSLIRKPTQSVKDFILVLQKQSMKCNFGAELSTHLRDRLVAGINNDEVKRKFLCEASLTYESAKAIAISHVSVDSAVKSEHDENSVLATVPKKSHYRQPKQSHARAHSSAPQATYSRNEQPHQKSTNNFSATISSAQGKGFCFSCGDKGHYRQSCKFRNSVCHFCKKVGHISRACRSKPRENTGTTTVTYCQDLDVDDSPGQEEFCLNIPDENISLDKINRIRRVIDVSDKKGKKTGIAFIYDTGSPYCFISIADLDPYDVSVMPTSASVKGLGGHIFEVFGEVNLFVEGIEEPVRFLVNDRWSLLGLHEILKLHPVIANTLLNKSCLVADAPSEASLSEMIEKVANCSGGIKIDPVHIDHDDSDPVFHKSRPIPFGLRDPVKKVFDKWVDSGIAVQVESSRWATPIVTPLKANGQPRVCGDYRITINPILRHHAAITPEPEDLFANLNGASVFSKIDLENAFLQIPLDESSQELTTLVTPFGLYSMKFLPFGWHVSSSVFQAVINDVIDGLPNVISYQDDLLVYATDEKEHDKALHQLLERLIAFNVRINKSKSIFRVKEITYLGYLVTSEGIQPDPSKFLPITSADEPRNQQELRSILGCLQYYSRFSSNFAHIAACLFDLCKKDCDFEWQECHSQALEQLKNEIFNKRLKPFSMSSQSTRLVCDASERAIGGVLEQDGSPVICISRKLSESEVGYSQTQKEALAIHWCVKRLHKYLYGLKFTIVTDHRSLIHIFNPRGSISKATSNMLQRWSWRLSSYDYDVEFQNGTRIPQADFLSRFAKAEADADSNALFVQPLPIDSSLISHETKRCYGPVLRAVRGGWSAKAKRQFHELYVIREDLSVSLEGHLIFKELTIIPPCLRKQIMSHLHIGHVGVEKMKSLARLLCWWPTINSDLQNFSRQCSNCITKTRNTPSSWSAWPATYEVNQRIHMDYAGPFMGEYYCLVLIDSFSKWPEVFLTKKADAAFTERCLRSYFSREGVSQTVVSDNGTHFTEAKLNKWLSSLNVIHLYSAPRHPKSNGLAENFIKTLKRAISSEIQSLSDGMDLERFIQSFLFQYRNADHCTTRERPSVLFRGRPLRSNVIGQQKVMFQRGNDLRFRQGVILRRLGKKMASIMDTEDGSIHNRHVEQLRFMDGYTSTTSNSASSQLSPNSSAIQIPVSNAISTPVSSAIQIPVSNAITTPVSNAIAIPTPVITAPTVSAVSPTIVAPQEEVSNSRAPNDPWVSSTPSDPLPTSSIPDNGGTEPGQSNPHAGESVSVSRYGRVRRRPERLNL